MTLRAESASPSSRAAGGVQQTLDRLWEELGCGVRRRSRLLTDDVWQLADARSRKQLDDALRADLLATAHDEQGRPLTAWQVYARHRGRLLGADPFETPEGPFYLRWKGSELAELEKRMAAIRTFASRMAREGVEGLGDDLPGLMAVMLRVSELCHALRRQWARGRR